jgi:hypothetical protein
MVVDLATNLMVCPEALMLHGLFGTKPAFLEGCVDDLEKAVVRGKSEIRHYILK